MSLSSRIVKIRLHCYENIKIEKKTAFISLFLSNQIFQQQL